MKFLLLWLSLTTLATWRPEYAQLSDEQRQWFRSQKNPTTKVPCCDTSDGSVVEEDIRDGHYWVRFDRTGGEWREIPDDIVIRDANRNGAPVVWYYYHLSGGVSTLMFRCYAPGAGL